MNIPAEEAVSAGDDSADGVVTASDGVERDGGGENGWENLTVPPALNLLCGLVSE